MKTYPLLIGAVLAIGSTAQAETRQAPANDAVTIGTAATDLTTAIAAAEKHVQGKAVRAEFEKRRGSSPVYDVEVVAGGKVFDVKVDAGNGTVIASAEDKADSDDDGDAVD